MVPSTVPDFFQEKTAERWPCSASTKSRWPASRWTSGSQCRCRYLDRQAGEPARHGGRRRSAAGLERTAGRCVPCGSLPAVVEGAVGKAQNTVLQLDGKCLQKKPGRQTPIAWSKVGLFTGRRRRGS